MREPPFCFLTDPLPRDFATDFRLWVRYDNLSSRARTPEDEAAVLAYAQQHLVHGALTRENLDAFLRFYSCGEEQQTQQQRKLQLVGSTPRGLDFAVDGPLLWAAFLQAYGIDLHDPALHLHWWEFMALLRALPEDCRICTIIDWRTHDLADLPTDAARKQYEKMRRLYALPEQAGGAQHRYATWADRKAAILARKQAAEKQP